MTDLAGEIRRYINENFIFEDDPALIPLDKPLFGSGLLDSAHMVHVISFLENRFGISIPSTDITPENLETIERMAAYVQRLGSRCSWVGPSEPT
jgi:acyl carrier protein